MYRPWNQCQIFQSQKFDQGTMSINPGNTVKRKKKKWLKEKNFSTESARRPDFLTRAKNAYQR